MSTNELPLFHSKVTEVPDNMSINNAIDTDTVDENMILAQLNQLREWQEAQRQTLLQQQLEQQKMMELEKQKLYNLFGLSANDSDLQNDGICSSESSYFLPCIPNPNVRNSDVNDTPKQSSYTNNAKLYDEKPLELHSPSINQLQKIIENIAIRSPKRDKNPIDDEDMDEIPKRPFLKRGEGLKNRFKISPDAFRLDKLPKYKYAQRMQKHAQTKESHKQRHQEITTNDTTAAAVAAPAASIARNGGGVTSEGHQNNRNDKCIHSIVAQRKCNNNIQPNRLVKQTNPQTQRLKLKPSKATTASNLQQNVLNDVKNGSHHIIQDAFGHGKLEQPAYFPQSQLILSPATKLLIDTPTRQFAHFQGDEISELKRFVQLEQDFNSSTYGGAAAADMDRNRRDENLLSKLKAGHNLSPKHMMADRNIDDIEEEDEEDERLQQSFSSESDMGDESKHVRFMSNAIAFGKNDATSSGMMSATAAQPIDNESEVPIYDVPRTSSPNDKSLDSFQKFKEKLFDRRLKQKFQNRLSVAKDFEISDLNSNKSSCEGDDNGTLATVIEMQEVGEQDKELLQERLLNLEHEIWAFREQNNELTKLIREHDMIRMSFDEERRDFQQRMENERINFEMYMHDQRLKMLNEKAKTEKKSKDARGLNQTEKNELVSLREKCAKYEAELCAQEQKHVAAQGRIRAQLRNSEKELKEVRFELDNLQRENKKLESENMRMRRQSNNKILTEINKSISKLAYSSDHHHSDGQYENQKDGIKEKITRHVHGVKKCSNKNAHKTVVAKVTSHRESLKGNHMRSKSAPNLHHTDSTDVAYELCSSDGENSESFSHDGENAHDKSSYFPSQTSQNKHRLVQAEDPDELEKTADESDAIAKNMKRVIENPDGSKDVWYPNGNLKKISADGMFIRMLYFNKDIKETDITEGIVKYYYAESDTWQTTYLDGLEIFEYPGGQTEHRYKNGTIEIRYPNGSVRITNPAREKKEGIKEEWKYADGSNAIQLTNGERILMLPNGQREVHANGHKRREYPDGTVKIVYPDGSQETRYSNGRVRLKNKDGKLIMDSETISI